MEKENNGIGFVSIVVILLIIVVIGILLSNIIRTSTLKQLDVSEEEYEKAKNSAEKWNEAVRDEKDAFLQIYNESLKMEPKH